MRLQAYEIEAIKKNFNAIFKEGVIYLFGSRTDDSAKGGDIDLYIQTPNRQNLREKKLDFLTYLKLDIGEQKIDIIVSQDKSRLIEEEAIITGIRL